MWTKLILPSSRSLRENMWMALEDRGHDVSVSAAADLSRGLVRSASPAGGVPVLQVSPLRAVPQGADHQLRRAVVRIGHSQHVCGQLDHSRRVSVRSDT